MNKKFKIIKNMLSYLILVSETVDKNTQLKDVREFFISMYKLLDKQ